MIPPTPRFRNKRKFSETDLDSINENEGVSDVPLVSIATDVVAIATDVVASVAVIAAGKEESCIVDTVDEVITIDDSAAISAAATDDADDVDIVVSDKVVTGAAAIVDKVVTSDKVGGNAVGGDEIEINDNMTVKELKNVAQDLGIKIPKSANKQRIITLLCS